MRRPDDLEATNLDEVLERALCNRQLEYYLGLHCARRSNFRLVIGTTALENPIDTPAIMMIRAYHGPKM